MFTLVRTKGKKIKRDDWKFLLSSFFVTIFLAFIIEIKPHHIAKVSI